MYKRQVLSCFDYRDGWEGPQVIENCDIVQPQLIDQKIETLDCNEKYIKRITETYIATDESGNVSEPCYQEILIERVNLDEIVPPRSDLEFECTDILELDENGYPDPIETGIPTLEGKPIYPVEDFLCNITVEYEDTELPAIGCTRKIMRMWRVTEWWCSETKIRPIPQMITIVDTQGPDVQAPRDMDITTGRRNCEVLVMIPPIEAEDACNNPVMVDVQYPGGFLKNQNGGMVTLGVGANKIIYTVYDQCYNSSQDSMIIYVRDETPPVAICEGHTVVALTDQSIAEVFAESIDDGSYDECMLDTLAVRRMDTPCLLYTSDAADELT